MSAIPGGNLGGNFPCPVALRGLGTSDPSGSRPGTPWRDVGSAADNLADGSGGRFLELRAGLLQLCPQHQVLLQQPPDLRHRLAKLAQHPRRSLEEGLSRWRGPLLHGIGILAAGMPRKGLARVHQDAPLPLGRGIHRGQERRRRHGPHRRRRSRSRRPRFADRN
jgi:hypothetical protein